MALDMMAPRDVSVLALLAESPSVSEATWKRTFDMLTDVFAQQVACALTDHFNPHVPTPAATKVAEALRKWAEENRSS